jgi:hypothetical protein
MMGAKNLKADAVQAKLQDLAKNDPSPRVAGRWSRDF